MVLILVTAGMAAPLVAPAAAMTFGSWGWGAGSVIVKDKLIVGGSSRYQRRRQSCDGLLGLFPQLQKLLMDSKNSTN